MANFIKIKENQPIIINPSESIRGGNWTGAKGFMGQDQRAVSGLVSGFPILNEGTFGGDGSDGNLIFNSGTSTIDLNNERVVVKNYKTIKITGTGALAFSNPHTNGTIIVLKAKGNVMITSSASPAIDASGMGAAGGSGVASNAGDGGNGGGCLILECGGKLNFTGEISVAGIDGSDGSGTPGAGSFLTTDDGDAGTALIGTAAQGGHSGTEGVSEDGVGGAAVINPQTSVFYKLMLLFTGGGGGEGGSTDSNNSGGGGGGGGGGCFVGFYNSLIVNSGTLTISGGSGGTGVSGRGGGGGGSTTAGGSASTTNGAAGGTGFSLLTQNTAFA